LLEVIGGVEHLALHLHREAPPRPPALHDSPAADLDALHLSDELPRLLLQRLLLLRLLWILTVAHGLPPQISALVCPPCSQQGGRKYIHCAAARQRGSGDSTALTMACPLPSCDTVWNDHSSIPRIRSTVCWWILRLVTWNIAYIVESPSSSSGMFRKSCPDTQSTLPRWRMSRAMVTRCCL